MKHIIIALIVAMLAGCGADVASSAATAAALKKQELEQGKRTMDQARQNIGAAVGAMQQGVEQAQDAADKQ